VVYWFLWGVYVGVTFLLALGFARSWLVSKKIKHRKREGGEPFLVSVLVTFHNEEERVDRIVQALLGQTYPDLEVILVDDRSTDSTWHRLQQYKRDCRVTLTRVEKIPPGYNSRKWALHQGIALANGEWIFVTDADCCPSPSWIETMVHFAREGHGDVILGFSPLKEGQNLWHFWIQFENYLTAYLYYGFWGLGIPFMGVGRNMGFRKEWYMCMNPYKGKWHEVSGSDDFLVQCASKVLPCLVPESVMPYQLRGKEKWNTYLRRRGRHFSAFFAYPLKVKLGLLFLLLVDWSFLTIGTGNWGLWFTGIGFRTLTFWLALGILGRKRAFFWGFYPVFYLLWLPYHLGINAFFRWKKIAEW